MIWGTGSYFSKVKKKLLHLVPPTTKKEIQYLMGLFRFWRQHVIHLNMQVSLIYWEAKKAASFEGDPNQEKTLPQIQAAMEMILPPGLCNTETSGAWSACGR